MKTNTSLLLSYFLIPISSFLFSFPAFAAVDGKKFESIPTGIVSFKSFVPDRDDALYAPVFLRCACSRTDFDRVLEALK